MKLGLISKYRTECMGFAILFVLGVHSLNFDIPYPGFIEKALGYGQIGVNIFFLLSGLGMHFALKKGTEGFYRKRAKKILPPYLLIAIPTFFIVDILLDKNNFFVYLYDLSTLRYWFEGIGFWYVAVQIVMYIAVPLHHSLNRKTGKYGWIINTAVIVVSLLLGYIFKKNSIQSLGTLFERYAVFISGYWIGTAVEKNRKFSLIGGGIAILTVWLKSFFKLSPDSMVINITLALAGFGLCMFLSVLLEKINGGIIGRVLSFLGSFTLEIYMMHSGLTWILLRCKDLWSSVPSWIIYWGISGGIAVVLGYVAYKVSEWIQKKI